MTADLERAAKAIRDKRTCPTDTCFEWGGCNILAIAALETLAESEAFVEAAAEALSITGTNNPNPKKPGEQLPQVPWDQQPDGWRDRCRGEAHAALRSGIAAVLGRKP